jgi:hypothetical protein
MVRNTRRGHSCSQDCNFTIFLYACQMLYRKVYEEYNLGEQRLGKISGHTSKDIYNKYSLLELSGLHQGQLDGRDM